MQSQTMEQYKFETPDHTLKIPDSLLAENAVILFKKRCFTTKLDWYSISHYSSTGSIISKEDPFGLRQYPVIFQKLKNEEAGETYLSENHQRIKVLNQNGIEDFSDYSFRLYSHQEIISFASRIIKIDGNIVLIDKSRLIITENQKDGFSNYDKVVVKYEHLEPGDEIELYVKIKGSNLHAFRFSFPDNLNQNSDKPWSFNKPQYNLFFHDIIPVLESEISITEYIFFKNTYLLVNYVPEPLVLKNDTSISCTFRLSNLPGIRNNSYGIPSVDLPYIHFNNGDKHKDFVRRKWRTDQENQLENIRMLFMEDFSYANLTGKRLTKKEILKNPLVQNSDKKYEKLQAFHKFINHEMKIVMAGNEEPLPTVNFLKAKEVDPVNLLKIYVHLFETLDVDYDFVIARNRYAGPPAQEDFQLHQFDKYLLRYKTPEGSYAFLFPKNEWNYYEINEIPLGFIGADAIVIPCNYAVPCKFIRINYSDQVRHFENKQMNVSIDMSQGIIHEEIVQTFSGTEFTRNKAEYLFAAKSFRNGIHIDLSDFGWFDEKGEWTIENFAIDSLSPPNLKINYSFSAKNDIGKLDDSTFSIPVANFISHRTLPTSEYSRVLDYYASDDFTRKINSFLIFDQKITFENVEDFRQIYEDEVCFYRLNASQINDTTIYMQSEYGLKSNVVPAKDYDKLRKLNEAYEKSRNLNLIFSTVRAIPGKQY